MPKEDGTLCIVLKKVTNQVVLNRIVAIEDDDVKGCVGEFLGLWKCIRRGK